MNQPPSVLLFGGASGERRVSVASAQHLCALLTDAQLLFEARDGQLHALTPEELRAHERPFETDLAPAQPARYASLRALLDDAALREHVFLLGYHGGRGEDGTVQAMLESRGLAFTGSDSASSARAFDKTEGRRCALSAGLRLAPSLELPAGDVLAIRDGLERMLAEHGRVVAKPVADGSSVGLYHLRAPDELPRAATEIANQQVPYLVEAFVTGRELTVGVLERADHTLAALPPSEVRVDPGRAFDFEGKYLGRGTLELTPAELDPAQTERAQQVALAAHRSLGCGGYSRTDMILVGEKDLIFLETNTLPGLTRASFFPQQLHAAGIPLGAFVNEQLALALERRAAQRGGKR